MKLKANKTISIAKKWGRKNNGGEFPSDKEIAIISHYLHNEGTRYVKPYKDKALTLLHKYNKQEERLDNNASLSDAHIQYSLFSHLLSTPFQSIANPTFTFIDLFAGIGGFRIAMQNLGGKCIFSSEWDTQAQKTYLLNYEELPFGDITKENGECFLKLNLQVRFK